MLALATLCLLGTAEAQVFVGVAPNLPAATEAVAVGSNAPWDLSGWTVTDGEGTVTLPPLRLQAGEALWLASDVDAWRGLQGYEPALAWDAAGRFQLADTGEGLRLVDPLGQETDAFAWGRGEEHGFEGSITRTSQGLVYRRDAGWPDTDSAADWVTPRLHRVGESDLDAPTFTARQMTLYSSPDSSHEVLAGLIAQARERLHLHVYQLGSLDLAAKLAAAKEANPGLDLQVLVDRSPVGLSAPDRHRTTQALLGIQEAGGGAHLAGHGRYNYHHLKVLVADGTVAVQSENWVESGVPRDPSTGNRGWGVAVHDRAIADWFAEWMAADRAAWDTELFDAALFDPLFTPVAEAAPRTGLYGPRVPPLRIEGVFHVRPLVSPDHTHDPRHDPVAALVDRAQSRVLVQQLDLSVTAANPLGWHAPDPLLDALGRAAGRNVVIQAQAAKPFSQTDAGNQPALDWLASRGAATSVLDRPGLGTLHNKGLVVDDRWVVLGSMNGNHHSRSANREVILLLDAPQAAQWYAGLFEADWDGRRAERDAGVIGEDLRSLPWAPLPSLLAVAGVAALLKVRRA